MSVSEEITRLQTARNKIRTKLVSLGLAESTDSLTQLSVVVDSIANQGAIQATVVEGQTYTIPAGYHNGSGTVLALSDTIGEAEKYKLQTKSVTPTKAQQAIAPDQGYYGLSGVSVAAIPAAYQDVSSVTATAADVLVGTSIVDSTGKLIPGEMLNQGAVSIVLDTLTTSYTIPAGYHNGSGTVAITLETAKNITPTKTAQTISPAKSKLLSTVVVGAIPDKYVDTSDATATDADILADKTAYVGGVKITGSITNNGAITGSIDGFSSTSFAIPTGYTTGGTVSLTDDIEKALAAI